MSRVPTTTDPTTGRTIVRLSGEIDILAEPALTAQLDALTGVHRPDVVVDLRRVTFLDCRGLAALVRARQRAVERAGCLRLVSTDPRFVRLLEATGLDGLFTVHARIPRPARVGGRAPLGRCASLAAS